jgi:ATP-dependent RNA helicase RhlE
MGAAIRARNAIQMTSFVDLGLSAPLLKALAEEGYTTPTPIQAQAIPHLLAGFDLLGIAQTGTGKTAAFVLPMLQKLSAETPQERRGRDRRTCRTLILAPTRELASQIAASANAYGAFSKLTVQVVFGGVPINRQIRALADGVDILVATPGRLLDLISQRAISLSHVNQFVLDEADQMLDLGFFRDIRRLVAMLPKARQNLFFSATMPDEIAKLAGEMLKLPKRVEVAPVATTAERVEQQVIMVDVRAKPLVLSALINDGKFGKTLVFSRTKHGADKIVRYLATADIHAAAIHGNKSQSNRERALSDFTTGKISVLVATDIAARGIDVDGVTHVINFDLPNVAEQYVHRIGRTARAGASGIAIAFCSAEERPFLKDIEKLTRQTIPRGTHELANTPAPSAPREDRRPGGREEDNARRGGRPPMSGRGRPGGGSNNGGQNAQGRGPRPDQRSSRPQATSSTGEAGSVSGEQRNRPAEPRRDSRPQGDHRSASHEQRGPRAPQGQNDRRDVRERAERSSEPRGNNNGLGESHPSWLTKGANPPARTPRSEPGKPTSGTKKQRWY